MDRVRSTGEERPNASRLLHHSVYAPGRPKRQLGDWQFRQSFRELCALAATSPQTATRSRPDAVE